LRRRGNRRGVPGQRQSQRRRLLPEKSRATRRGETPGGKKIDVDGNGSVQPLEDGLMILRRLFGFSGASLTINAVAGNCMRCDATAIAAYIDGLAS
jgi:hypothetical protein